jgi:hypothetical protein
LIIFLVFVGENKAEIVSDYQKVGVNLYYLLCDNDDYSFSDQRNIDIKYGEGLNFIREIEKRLSVLSVSFPKNETASVGTDNNAESIENEEGNEEDEEKDDDDNNDGEENNEEDEDKEDESKNESNNNENPENPIIEQKTELQTLPQLQFPQLQFPPQQSQELQELQFPSTNIIDVKDREQIKSNRQNYSNFESEVDHVLGIDGRRKRKKTRYRNEYDEEDDDYDYEDDDDDEYENDDFIGNRRNRRLQRDFDGENRIDTEDDDDYEDAVAPEEFGDEEQADDINEDDDEERFSEKRRSRSSMENREDDDDDDDENGDDGDDDEATLKEDENEDDGDGEEEDDDDDEENEEDDDEESSNDQLDNVSSAAKEKETPSDEKSNETESPKGDAYRDMMKQKLKASLTKTEEFSSAMSKTQSSPSSGDAGNSGEWKKNPVVPPSFETSNVSALEAIFLREEDEQVINIYVPPEIPNENLNPDGTPLSSRDF